MKLLLTRKNSKFVKFLFNFHWFFLKDYCYYFFKLSGIRKTDPPLAVVFWTIHCPSIACFYIFLNREWSHFCLQHFHMSLLAAIAVCKFLQLDFGVLVVFGAVWSIKTGGSGSFKGNLKVFYIRFRNISLIRLCFCHFSDGNHGFSSCIHQPVHGWLTSNNAIHYLNYSLNWIKWRSINFSRELDIYKNVCT